MYDDGFDDNHTCLTVSATHAARRQSALDANLEQVLEYALGVSDDAPETAVMGVAPSRWRGFVQRFLSANDLKIETLVAKPAAPPPTAKPAPVPATATARPVPAAQPPRPTNGQTILKMYGTEGAVMLASGETPDAIHTHFRVKLEAENARLITAIDRKQQQLDALVALSTPDAIGRIAQLIVIPGR